VVFGTPYLVLKLSHSPSWHQKEHHPHGNPWADDSSSSKGPPDLPKTSDGVLITDGLGRCNMWTTQESVSHGIYSASFHRSVTATGTFSVLSNVSHEAEYSKGILGNLVVDINPDKLTREAYISASVQASSKHLRDRTYICFDNNSEGNTLSIYVPSNLTSKESLTFDITILFPQSPQLHVKNLKTYLPKFSQTIGDLGSYISFGKVTIEGPLSKVMVESLRAHKILVKSSLAEIRGAFNVTDSLALDTIGAPIHADITLVHEQTSKKPTFLSLDTGNSEITANVTLMAPRIRKILRNPPPPQFFTTMKTFNAPLTVDIVHHPSTLPAPLQLRAQNNVAECKVILDSKFEGTFDLQTKLSSADLDDDVVAVDPSGMSRQRSYFYDHASSNRKFGWVGWGDRPKKWDPSRQGHVEIISSLSPVLLQLS